MLEKKEWFVISYCEIPQELTESHYITENNPDCYVELEITTKEDQTKFDDDFGIENWVINNYPELEGKKILIHIDY